MSLSMAQIRFCAMECERQRTTPSAVAGMCEAFEYAHIMNTTLRRGEFLTAKFVESLGRKVEPNKNEFGFRKMPVHFGDPTKQALDASLIQRAINSLFTHGQDNTAEEGYYEFEKIHPFNDGNGRVGAILYNIWKGTMDYPTIPPDMFS